MLPKTFEEYYFIQTENILRHYNIAKKFSDVEGIHEMRVEIKKLRAFFNLVEWINPDFQTIKYFSKIRNLFKSAGRIRDIHIQQELTMHWVKKANLEVSEYYNYLKQQELKNQAQFSKTCKRFKTTEFDKSWIIIQDSLNILPQNYIQFKSEERFYKLIENLIHYKEKAEFAGDDYHKIRILSKESRYTLDILQTCFPEIGQFEVLDLKLRDLHRALGKWHDNEVNLLSIKDFLENFSGQSFFNRNSYDQFIQNLEQDKKKWLLNFEERWKEFNEFLNHKDAFNFLETKFSLN